MNICGDAARFALLYSMFVWFVIPCTDRTGDSQMGEGQTSIYGMWNVIVSKCCDKFKKIARTVTSGK